MRPGTEAQKLLGSENAQPVYDLGSAPTLPPPKVDTSARTQRIALLSKNQRNGSSSMSYRGPAYMSTSAFQTMAEEIERQKEHSRLSRSASVGGDMVPSALNPVLTGLEIMFLITSNTYHTKDMNHIILDLINFRTAMHCSASNRSELHCSDF